MGKAAEHACLQFRMLNRGKGPAVFSPRAQTDRMEYRAYMRRALESGRLAGADLDVFKNEPTALNTGGAARHGLWEGCRNLVAMPHSAAFSPRYIERCFRELTDEGLV